MQAQISLTILRPCGVAVLRFHGLAAVRRADKLIN